MKPKYILILLFISVYSFGSAQIDSVNNELIEIDSDTVFINNTVSDSSLFKKKKPGRAALFSAILPGAGQVYNNKMWKVPIVYSALGGVAFSYNLFNVQYKKYLSLYLFTLDSSYVTSYEMPEGETQTTLATKKDTYRRNRDLSAVGFLMVYLLNIVDATVDAHLSDFDIDEDLSIKIYPDIIPVYSLKSTNTLGLTLSINFK